MHAAQKIVDRIIVSESSKKQIGRPKKSFQTYFEKPLFHRKFLRTPMAELKLCEKTPSISGMNLYVIPYGMRRSSISNPSGIGKYDD